MTAHTPKATKPLATVLVSTPVHTGLPGTLAPAQGLDMLQTTVFLKYNLRSLLPLQKQWF